MERLGLQLLFHQCFRSASFSNLAWAAVYASQGWDFRVGLEFGRRTAPFGSRLHATCLSYCFGRFLNWGLFIWCFGRLCGQVSVFGGLVTAHGRWLALDFHLVIEAGGRPSNLLLIFKLALSLGLLHSHFWAHTLAVGRIGSWQHTW